MGVAYNEISGTTESVVNNAELMAAGNDAGVAVNERNKDNDNVVSDNSRKGVIIAADAEHKLTNVALSGGVAISADVAWVSQARLQLTAFWAQLMLRQPTAALTQA